MNLKLIKKICRLEKDELKQILSKYLRSKGYKYIIENEMYIMAEGELPICLIAHMDTVFRYLPQEFFYDNEQKVLWSPGGAGFDDRAGIYAIISILDIGYKPSIILTDKEEFGCIGAKDLIKHYPYCYFQDCRALIQLDRSNREDCVFYNCNNHAFTNYIQQFGFQLNSGSFSDISVIAPAWGIAAVNLSIGYEDEHSESERLHCDWCDLTIKRTKQILEKSKEMKSYTYIPRNYSNQVFNENEIDPAEEDWIGNSYMNICAMCGMPLSNCNDGQTITNSNTIYKLCDSCFSYYVNHYID